jgi:hypothetical protein
MEEHFAAIGSAARTAYKPFGFEAVRQLDGGVMQNLQVLGKKSNGCLLPARQAFECEQSLMLLWFDAGRAGSLLAEIQKPADLIAKFREHFE